MNAMSNILLVEDKYEERAVLCDSLRQWGFHVTAVNDGGKGFKKFKEQDFSVVISDLKMPKMDGIELLTRIKEQKDDVPVILVSGYGTVEFAVEAMRLGAFDFMVKPFSSNVMEAVVKRALATHSSLRDKKSSNPSEIRIITKSPQLNRLLDLASSIADSRAPVFIQGESGTGKELIARFIHKEGAGQKKPFVALNCAALPDGLLESELFGHEKGAFTGAVGKKLGKFELADGGTILLDEISEMNINLQAKLLRVLQESEVDRVGGRKPIPINVRVIATTNQDIEAAVKADKFRADLYYRLNVIPIKLPALRERKEDVLPLAEHFVEKYNKIDGRNVKGLEEDVSQTLVQMQWPGNVRELENIIERAVLLCKGERITQNDLFLGDSPHCVDESDIAYTGSLKDMERKMIFHALDQTDGNRTHAADLLGISVRTLRNKLHEYKQKMETL
jgi:two-component system response regulator FlrC